MRVHIWIHKDDIMKGVITEYHYQCPQPGWQNYVQISITSDEFVKLEDSELEERLETYPDFVEKHYKNKNDN